MASIAKHVNMMHTRKSMLFFQNELYTFSSSIGLKVFVEIIFFCFNTNYRELDTNFT